MEFRCEECSHVGTPDSMRPSEGGVELVCANCGHASLLDLGEADAVSSADSEETDGAAEDVEVSSQPDVAEDVVSTEETTDDGGADGSLEDLARAKGVNLENLEGADTDVSAGFGTGDDVRNFLRTDAMESLVPPTGEGPRCPKCAWLLEAGAKHCERCGLDQEEACNYESGEAPWELPPRDKEAEHEQAMLLWESLEEDWSEEKLGNFVEFVSEAELLDLGVRKLRFHLVDHPDDDYARECLRDLAESLQSKIIVAQVKAQADADEFQDDVSRFKKRLMLVALIFWGGIFLLFLGLFWDNCTNAL